MMHQEDCITQFTDGKQGNFLGSAIYHKDVPDIFCNSFNRTQIFCDDHDVCVLWLPEICPIKQIHEKKCLFFKNEMLI